MQGEEDREVLQRTKSSLRKEDENMATRMGYMSENVEE
jgi:hypothetical protein